MEYLYGQTGATLMSSAEDLVEDLPPDLDVTTSEDPELETVTIPTSDDSDIEEVLFPTNTLLASEHNVMLKIFRRRSRKQLKRVQLTRGASLVGTGWINSLGLLST